LLRAVACGPGRHAVGARIAATPARGVRSPRRASVPLTATGAVLRAALGLARACVAPRRVPGAALAELPGDAARVGGRACDASTRRATAGARGRAALLRRGVHALLSDALLRHHLAVLARDAAGTALRDVDARGAEAVVTTPAAVVRAARVERRAAASGTAGEHERRRCEDHRAGAEKKKPRRTHPLQLTERTLRRARAAGAP
jgi:hypothetical protein